jgi:hypothetical protein
VEGVEGLDERVAEAVLDVLGAGVPVAGVGVEHERAVLHLATPFPEVLLGLSCRG